MGRRRSAKGRHTIAWKKVARRPNSSRILQCGGPAAPLARSPRGRLSESQVSRVHAVGARGVASLESAQSQYAEGLPLPKSWLSIRSKRLRVLPCAPLMPSPSRFRSASHQYAIGHPIHRLPRREDVNRILGLISSHLISSHLVSSYLISSHLREETWRGHHTCIEHAYRNSQGCPSLL